jgi:hypothetical protein
MADVPVSLEAFLLFCDELTYYLTEPVLTQSPQISKHRTVGHPMVFESVTLSLGPAGLRLVGKLAVPLLDSPLVSGSTDALIEIGWDYLLRLNLHVPERDAAVDVSQEISDNFAAGRVCGPGLEIRGLKPELRS